MALKHQFLVQLVDQQADFSQQNALENILGIGLYTISIFANRLTGA